MKRILSYKDFHNRKVCESKSIPDIEKHPEEENIKIIEVKPDGIVATNSDGELTILSNEDIIEK